MFDNITVILQGALSPRTTGIIKAWRTAAPGCEIILSTWVYDKNLESLVDLYIINSDPGGLPVTHQEQIIRNENTNRQIISTTAGLGRSTRPLSIKWRTDFDLCPQLANQFLVRYTPVVSDKTKNRFIALSINSTNPFAGAGFVAQLSDWMYFGKTEFLKQLLPHTTVPNTFENVEVPVERMNSDIFPFARFSAEQWMLREGFNRVYGIDLIRFDDKKAIRAYLRLIGDAIFIVNPRVIGLVTHKYDHFFNPKWKTLREFLGFRLSTISQIDSWLLGIASTRCLAINILKIKGYLFNVYKYAVKQFRKS